MKRRTLWIIGILVLSMALVACKGTPHKRGISSVTVSIDTAKNAAGYQAPGKSMAPVVVQTLKFMISAPDMETITRTVTVSPATMVTESFDVPNGNGRVLMVEALGAAGTVYQGGTMFDLTGGPKELTVVMQAMFFNKLVWTLEEEEGTALAKDGSGNIIVAGHTKGGLDGNTNLNPNPPTPGQKTHDAFVTKYSTTGSRLWTRQFGSIDDELVYGIAVDNSGNIVVVGSTSGNMPGNTNAGLSDCFVTAITPTGSIAWHTMIGTAGYDFGEAAAVDPAGNILVTGYTDGLLSSPTATKADTDVFIAKLSPAGVVQWQVQADSADYDFGESIVADGSYVYVAGYTYGSMPGGVNPNPDPSGNTTDLFLMKLDTSVGSQLGVYQMGTSDIDEAWSLAVDPSGVAYVAGGTWGGLDSNINSNPSTTSSTADIFVTTFSTTQPVANWHQPGTTIQIGSAATDIAYGTALDAANNALYLTGMTLGGLPFMDQSGNDTTAGLKDLFVMKIDLAAPITPAWTRQMGSSFEDEGRSIIVDATGDVLAAGTTRGGFTIPFSYDAFLVIYDSLGNKK